MVTDYYRYQDNSNYSIKIFTSDGKEVHHVTFKKISKFGNIAVDDEGLVYVADVDSKKILTL